MKRYEHEYYGPGDAVGGNMNENEDGTWVSYAEALRIIDQLTAALEAAERRANGLKAARQPGKSALPEMLALRERAEGAEKRERQSIDEARAAVGHANTQRRKAERLRSRAEALQARVAELEALLRGGEWLAYLVEDALRGR